MFQWLKNLFTSEKKCNTAPLSSENLTTGACGVGGTDEVLSVGATTCCGTVEATHPMYEGKPKTESSSCSNC